MPQSWMVIVEGQAYGPYTLEQMQAFIAEGRLVPQSLIAAPDEEAYPAETDPVLVEFFDEAESQEPFGRHPESEEGVQAHFVIIADMKLSSVAELEEEIYNLGEVATLLPQAWLLTTTKSFNTVRNMLLPKLTKADILFVVDATRDKVSWFNFGLETDSRIRRVWDRKLPAKIV